MDVPAGVWRHRKGQHYLVIGVASDSNNVDPRPEAQVVYVSLERAGRTTRPLHTRSLSEFLERFEPLDDLRVDLIAHRIDQALRDVSSGELNRSYHPGTVREWARYIAEQVAPLIR